MRVARLVCLAVAPLLLSACVAEFDMQGNDPREYYAENPVKNKVESRQFSHEFELDAGNRLSPAARNALRDALRGISPMAVDKITLELPASQLRNAERKAYIAKFLRSLGYDVKQLQVAPLDSLMGNEAHLLIDYAVAVPPHCPDWRTSSVTTYSNSGKGGFGCADAVNLGQMVADPRDLEQGSGVSAPSSPRNSLVIQQYRSNATMGEGAGAGASGN